MLNLKDLWFGILPVFLSQQFALGSTVYVAIDRTTWRDINLLMASIVWKKRAIPLYWERLKTLGNSHYDEQTAFLSIALPEVADYRVGVLGDREFCSVDLARWLGAQGHYFCLRQKKSTYVLIEDKPWLKLGQLGLTPGTKCFYNAVTMTQRKGFDKAHLAGKWKRRYRGFAPEEPWFLLTNLESLDDAVAAYQKRFDIEMCQPLYPHRHLADAAEGVFLEAVFWAFTFSYKVLNRLLSFVLECFRWDSNLENLPLPTQSQYFTSGALSMRAESF